MRPEKKRKLLQRRRWRIRKHINGTAERPRMSVRMTGKNIYVQFIDDDKGVTLVSASSMHKDAPDRDALRANVESATKLGAQAAEKAKAAGISKVVFDRSGAQYHGKVKALADAAREGGLDF
ncbi:MAG: 50S ribosomal protein L18 [Verrucomicrobiales bacterium]|nr:50S ribosomal protein L18 [Verrucomicrobiales bacterium]|tara:strand:- start:10153 stop:10518 length:366 start_codon:yes stop_codon:yes gene_type:complete